MGSSGVMTTDSSLDEVFAPYPAVLSVEQVAELLNTSSRSVYRALEESRLPGHKPMGRWLIYRDQLRKHLEDQARNRKVHPSA